MKDLKRKGKLLSLILRHDPAKAGLTLDAEGWVSVDDLLSGLKRLKKPMTRELLEEIVRDNDKKRFTISQDGLRIRAAQGHSVKVSLGLEPTVPPNELYHGTATRFLDEILSSGLKPMSRQHVHLSADIATATKVGQRHGKVVILNIDARGLHASGQDFYQADNGVWLSGPISPQWFELTEK
jgi:putative RNA 2'-phosphotransferase